jgi:oligoribonuclease NrnB/cAMP/cGMP phosphodiesterase (DHH superfamily)
MQYVLYHKSCPDGFAAALAAWKSLGTNDAYSDPVHYIPVQYGDPIPDMADESDVFILDFSYDRSTILGLCERMAAVVVIDHHKTAEADLTGLAHPKLQLIFDRNQSGAVLSWVYFHGTGVPVPTLFKYVQDRDLWTWKLGMSREFSARISVEPYEFEVWSELTHRLNDDDYFSEFVGQGVQLLKQKNKYILSLADTHHFITIADHRVPFVNSPIFQSEIGERLCELHPDAPFAAIYFESEIGVEIWSLRSKNGFDVSAVAKLYGGGGHAAAAGFKRKIMKFVSI